MNRVLRSVGRLRTSACIREHILALDDPSPQWLERRDPQRASKTGVMFDFMTVDICGCTAAFAERVFMELSATARRCVAMKWRDPLRIVAIINPLKEARVALRMIREYIELHMPAGTLPARLYTSLRATDEAEVLIDAMQQSALPFRYLWCPHCQRVRPFGFIRLRRGEQNNYTTGQLICHACHTVVVTLHNSAAGSEFDQQYELFERESGSKRVGAKN
jgi:hypothetical protein